MYIYIYHTHQILKQRQRERERGLGAVRRARRGQARHLKIGWDEFVQSAHGMELG